MKLETRPHINGKVATLVHKDSVVSLYSCELEYFVVDTNTHKVIYGFHAGPDDFHCGFSTFTTNLDKSKP